MKRYQSTADYAAIAVAPVLIFVMISALANFLVLILYQGGFPQRVAWTLLMFTMGSVAIARIAIEQNRSYSLGYAAALGLATFVVMSQFVGSPIFCGFILVVIAFLSDVIVRDCTIIDDDLDASGEGLIDAGRLFVKQQIDGESSEPRKKTHQPGRTVMYLAFGALPLFGLGQFMVRSEPGTWTRAQVFLGFYLFAALALMVTTSFLGLRRYLRQRSAEMPSDVTVSWLGGGIALIAAVLLIAYMAPLPGQALASIELPQWIDSSTDLTASRFGWGDEAAEQKVPEAATTTDDPRADRKEIHSETMQEGAEAGDVGDGNRPDGPAGKQQGGKKQSAGSKDDAKGDSKPSTEKDSQGSQTQSDTQRQGEQRQGEQGQDKQGQDKQGQSETEREQQGQDNQTDAESKSASKDDPRQPSPEEGSQDNNQPADSQSDAQQPSASQSPGEMLSKFFEGVGSLIKLLIIAALAVVVISFLWLNRDRFMDWLRGMLNADQPEATERIEELLLEPLAPPRPFSSFKNPIGSESDLRRVVVITFQAFEAWAREQGATRGKDETPSEFVRRAAMAVPNVGRPASDVVDAYNRIVYGRGRATKKDLDAARQVWQLMR